MADERDDEDFEPETDEVGRGDEELIGADEDDEEFDDVDESDEDEAPGEV